MPRIPVAVPALLRKGLAVAVCATLLPWQLPAAALAEDLQPAFTSDDAAKAKPFNFDLAKPRARAEPLEKALLERVDDLKNGSLASDAAAALPDAFRKLSGDFAQLRKDYDGLKAAGLSDGAAKLVAAESDADAPSSALALELKIEDFEIKALIQKSVGRLAVIEKPKETLTTDDWDAISREAPQVEPDASRLDAYCRAQRAYGIAAEEPKKTAAEARLAMCGAWSGPSQRLKGLHLSQLLSARPLNTPGAVADDVLAPLREKLGKRDPRLASDLGALNARMAQYMKTGDQASLSAILNDIQTLDEKAGNRDPNARAALLEQIRQRATSPQLAATIVFSAPQRPLTDQGIAVPGLQAPAPTAPQAASFADKLADLKKLAGDPGFAQAWAEFTALFPQKLSADDFLKHLLPGGTQAVSLAERVGPLAAALTGREAELKADGEAAALHDAYDSISHRIVDLIDRAPYRLQQGGDQSAAVAAWRAKWTALIKTILGGGGAKGDWAAAEERWNNDKDVQPKVAQDRARAEALKRLLAALSTNGFDVTTVPQDLRARLYGDLGVEAFPPDQALSRLGFIGQAMISADDKTAASQQKLVDLLGKLQGLLPTDGDPDKTLAALQAFYDRGDNAKAFEGTDLQAVVAQWAQARKAEASGTAASAPAPGQPGSRELSRSLLEQLHVLRATFGAESSADAVERARTLTYVRQHNLNRSVYDYLKARPELAASHRDFLSGFDKASSLSSRPTQDQLTAQQDLTDKVKDVLQGLDEVKASENADEASRKLLEALHAIPASLRAALEASGAPDLDRLAQRQERQPLIQWALAAYNEGYFKDKPDEWASLRDQVSREFYGDRYVQAVTAQATRLTSLAHDASSASSAAERNRILGLAAGGPVPPESLAGALDGVVNPQLVTGGFVRALPDLLKRSDAHRLSGRDQILLASWESIKNTMLSAAQQYASRDADSAARIRAAAGDPNDAQRLIEALRLSNIPVFDDRLLRVATDPASVPRTPSTDEQRRDLIALQQLRAQYKGADQGLLQALLDDIGGARAKTQENFRRDQLIFTTNDETRAQYQQLQTAVGRVESVAAKAASAADYASLGLTHALGTRAMAQLRAFGGLVGDQIETSDHVDFLTQANQTTEAGRERQRLMGDFFAMKAQSSLWINLSSPDARVNARMNGVSVSGWVLGHPEASKIVRRVDYATGDHVADSRALGATGNVIDGASVAPPDLHTRRDGLEYRLANGSGHDFASLDGRYVEQVRNVVTTIPQYPGVKLAAYLDNEGNTVYRPVGTRGERGFFEQPDPLQELQGKRERPELDLSSVRRQQTVTVSTRNSPDQAFHLSYSITQVQAKAGDQVIALSRDDPNARRTLAHDETVVLRLTKFGRDEDHFQEVDYQARTLTERNGTSGVQYALRGDAENLAENRARTVLSYDAEGRPTALYSESLQIEHGDPNDKNKVTSLKLVRRELNGGDPSVTYSYMMTLGGQTELAGRPRGTIDHLLADSHAIQRSDERPDIDVRIDRKRFDTPEKYRAELSRVSGVLSGALSQGTGRDLTGRIAALAEFFDGQRGTTAKNNGTVYDVSLTLRSGSNALIVNQLTYDRAARKADAVTHGYNYFQYPEDLHDLPRGDLSQPGFKRKYDQAELSNALAMLRQHSGESEGFVELGPPEGLPIGFFGDYKGRVGVHSVEIGASDEAEAQKRGHFYYAADITRGFGIDKEELGRYKIGETTSMWNGGAHLGDYVNNSIRYSEWGERHPMWAAVAGGVCGGVIKGVLDPKMWAITAVTMGSGALVTALAETTSGVLVAVRTTLEVVNAGAHIYFDAMMIVGGAQSGGQVIVGVVTQNADMLNAGAEGVATVAAQIGMFKGLEKTGLMGGETKSDKTTETGGRTETTGGETRTTETRGNETRTTETRGNETRTTETRGNETRTTETRGNETRTTETRGNETQTRGNNETRGGNERAEVARNEPTRAGPIRSEGESGANGRTHAGADFEGGGARLTGHEVAGIGARGLVEGGTLSSPRSGELAGTPEGGTGTRFFGEGGKAGESKSAAQHAAGETTASGQRGAAPDKAPSQAAPETQAASAPQASAKAELASQAEAPRIEAPARSAETPAETAPRPDEAARAPQGAEGPRETVSENAGERPSESLGEKPMEKVAEEKPSEKTGEQPAEKPPEKTGENPTERRGEEPTEKFGEKPSEKAGEVKAGKVGENAGERPSEPRAAAQDASPERSPLETRPARSQTEAASRAPEPGPAERGGPEPTAGSGKPAKDGWVNRLDKWLASKESKPAENAGARKPAQTPRLFKMAETFGGFIERLAGPIDRFNVWRRTALEKLGQIPGLGWLGRWARIPRDAEGKPLRDPGTGELVREIKVKAKDGSTTTRLVPEEPGIFRRLLLNSGRMLQGRVGANAAFGRPRTYDEIWHPERIKAEADAKARLDTEVQRDIARASAQQRPPDIDPRLIQGALESYRPGSDRPPFLSGYPDEIAAPLLARLYTDRLTQIRNNNYLQAHAAELVDKYGEVVMMDGDFFGSVDRALKKKYDGTVGGLMADEVLARLVGNAAITAEESGIHVEVIRKGGEEILFLAPKGRGRDVAQMIRAAGEKFHARNLELGEVLREFKATHEIQGEVPDLMEAIRKQAVEDAERKREEGDPPVDEENVKRKVGTTSAGVARLDSVEDDTPLEVIEHAATRADGALDKAKKAGKSRVAVELDPGGEIHVLANAELPVGDRPSSRRSAGQPEAYERALDALRAGDRAKFLEAIQTDPQTGLGNRESIRDNMGEVLRRFDHVYKFEVDNFKAINDDARMGHKAGDALLLELGRVVREAQAEVGRELGTGEMKVARDVSKEFQAPGSKEALELFDRLLKERLAKDDPLTRAVARSALGHEPTDAELAEVRGWIAEGAAKTSKDPSRVGTITGDIARITHPERGSASYDAAVETASKRVEAAKDARNAAFLKTRPASPEPPQVSPKLLDAVDRYDPDRAAPEPEPKARPKWLQFIDTLVGGGLSEPQKAVLRGERGTPTERPSPAEPRIGSIADGLDAYTRDYYENAKQAGQLERLAFDPEFEKSGSNHPAYYADHGDTHKWNTINNSVDALRRALDAGIIKPRSGAHAEFMEQVAGSLGAMHDMWMQDLTATGRKFHPHRAAQEVFREGFDPVVAEIMSGPIGRRILDLEGRGKLSQPADEVVREILSMSYAHSKSNVPLRVLDDPAALRVEMQKTVRADTGLSADQRPDLSVERYYTREGGFENSYRWITESPELSNDVVDAIRSVRSGDAFRYRGAYDFRSLTGANISVDARTGRAVYWFADPVTGRKYATVSDNPLSVGEANTKITRINGHGQLEMGSQRGAYGTPEAQDKVAEATARVFFDVYLDFAGSFDGMQGREIVLRRAPDERSGAGKGFSEKVAEALRRRYEEELPRLRQSGKLVDADRMLITIEGALPEKMVDKVVARKAAALEDANYNAGLRVGAQNLESLWPRVQDGGIETKRIDKREALKGARLVTFEPGEIVMVQGAPPGYVYVPVELPTGSSLEASVGKGYNAFPLREGVPVGEISAVTGNPRNADVRVAGDKPVKLLMLPRETFLKEWTRFYEHPDLVRRLRRDYKPRDPQVVANGRLTEARRREALKALNVPDAQIDVVMKAHDEENKLGLKCPVYECTPAQLRGKLNLMLEAKVPRDLAVRMIREGFAGSGPEDPSDLDFTAPQPPLDPRQQVLAKYRDGFKQWLGKTGVDETKLPPTVRQDYLKHYFESVGMDPNGAIAQAMASMPENTATLKVPVKDASPLGQTIEQFCARYPGVDPARVRAELAKYYKGRGDDMTELQKTLSATNAAYQTKTWNNALYSPEFFNAHIRAALEAGAPKVNRDVARAAKKAIESSSDFHKLNSADGGELINRSVRMYRHIGPEELARIVKESGLVPKALKEPGADIHPAMARMGGLVRMVELRVADNPQAKSWLYEFTEHADRSGLGATVATAGPIKIEIVPRPGQTFIDTSNIALKLWNKPERGWATAEAISASQIRLYGEGCANGCFLSSPEGRALAERLVRGEAAPRGVPSAVEEPSAEDVKAARTAMIMRDPKLPSSVSRVIERELGLTANDPLFVDISKRGSQARNSHTNAPLGDAHAPVNPVQVIAGLFYLRETNRPYYDSLKNPQTGVVATGVRGGVDAMVDALLNTGALPPRSKGRNERFLNGVYMDLPDHIHEARKFARVEPDRADGQDRYPMFISFRASNVHSPGADYQGRIVGDGGTLGRVALDPVRPEDIVAIYVPKDRVAQTVARLKGTALAHVRVFPVDILPEH